MVPRHDATVMRAASALARRLRVDEAPRVMLVLGSGLAAVADAVEEPVDVPVLAIPGLPASTVPGHRSVLRYGRLGPIPVLVQMGRVHLYEGHNPAAVTRTVEVGAALGCSTLVITNAAGGVDQTLTPGDLLLITDQLNLTGASPLTGIIRQGAPIFQDMTRAYDVDLAALARGAAGDLGMTLREGVYAGVRGPAFETPAEVAMLRSMGASVVGMSTVLEVIAARSRGMRVLGLSSVTNVHRPDQDTVSHEEVLAVGASAARSLGQLVLGTVGRL